MHGGAHQPGPSNWLQTACVGKNTPPPTHRSLSVGPVPLRQEPLGRSWILQIHPEGSTCALEGNTTVFVTQEGFKLPPLSESTNTRLSRWTAETSAWPAAPPTCLRWAVLGRFHRRLHVDLILGHQLQLADLHPRVLDPLWRLQETDNGQRSKLATFTAADLLKAIS